MVAGGQGAPPQALWHPHRLSPTRAEWLRAGRRARVRVRAGLRVKLRHRLSRGLHLAGQP